MKKHEPTINLHDANGFVNRVYQSGAETPRHKGINARLTFQKRDGLNLALGVGGYDYAGWEVWSDDEEEYGEGGIWINPDTGAVYDYDGAFTCPPIILDGLARIGYDVSEIDHRND